MIILKELETHSFTKDCYFTHKPYGWSVHNEEPSLLSHLKKSYTQIHFVNRIDQETSGLVLWTTNSKKVDGLQNLLNDVESHKIYRALTAKPRLPREKNWIWNHKLSPRAEGRNNPYGKENDQVEALSLVEIWAENQWFYDLKIEIKTGRQHQIRKHACGDQLPIVGDSRYGRSGLNKKISETYGEDRLFLHSWIFEADKKSIQIQADLPDSFIKLMKS